MPDLPLTMPVAPEGFCNSLNDANWVQTLLDLIEQGVAKFEGSGFTVILNQSTAPGVDDRDKLWRDTVTGRVYEWTGGAWTMPHPEPPGSKSRRWWVGSLAELGTYDGGDAGAPGLNSGPMWEEDTDFQGRTPIHPGSIPSSDPAQAVTVGTNIGSGTVALTSDNIPLHSFFTAKNQNQGGGTPLANTTDSVAFSGGGMGSENYVMLSASGVGKTADVGPTNEYGKNPVDQVNLVQPSRGIYLIKRTAIRANYVGA